MDFKSITDRIRIHIIESVTEAKSGHVGGSLSLVEIMAVLYFSKMNVDPDNPNWENRDRLILSKGHASPVLYATLAEKGFFPVSELTKLRKFGERLQGHPDMHSTPGVDVSSGSLGQGLSIANGMALAAKMDNKDYRIFVILGDGEIQEGQIWEAAMTTAHYNLNNVIPILDLNKLQLAGSTEEIMDIEPVVDKFTAFGWNVISIDGHDCSEISDAIDNATKNKNKPTIIIADTIKGKGVSFMENNVNWHGVAPTIDQCELALQELRGTS